MTQTRFCIQGEHDDCRDGKCWCNCHDPFSNSERYKLRLLIAKLDDEEEEG